MCAQRSNLRRPSLGRPAQSAEAAHPPGEQLRSPCPVSTHRHMSSGYSCLVVGRFASFLHKPAFVVVCCSEDDLLGLKSTRLWQLPLARLVLVTAPVSVFKTALFKPTYLLLGEALRLAHRAPVTASTTPRPVMVCVAY